MTKRLTLELDEEVVERAAAYSRKTGQPVSQVVSDLIDRLPWDESASARDGSEAVSNDMNKVDRHVADTSDKADSKTSAAPRNASPIGRVARDLPPIVRSLVGILEGTGADEEDYRRHLEEKYR